MSISLHHHAADAEAGLAVEESAFYNIGANEIDARAENPRQDAGLLPTFVVRLRAQFGEMELLLAEGLGRVPRIVQQVAAQQGFLRCFFVFQPLVDDAFPLGEAALPDADLGLGIEPAAFDPLSAVVVEAVHCKHLVLCNVIVFQRLDGLLQLVRKGFIGIDAEDEVASGEFVGEVFLVRVAEPVLAEELHAIAVTDGLGRIGGMRVNDDDLVGNILNGVKALRDFLFFVEGDDDDRKGVHGRKFSAKVGFFSYF
ncbi:MAG: hypothetical protein AUK64_1912 [bacterium P201]|nr:MAG: hypothetical protein AUK64_1912 [bacterium P201]